MQAALRKRAGPEPFALGELAVHHEERRVAVGGRAVRLTALEWELLRALSVNAGRVLAYDALIEQLWSGPDQSGDADRVRTLVKQLRRKLGDDSGRARYVLNERNVGYRMPRSHG